MGSEKSRKLKSGEMVHLTYKEEIMEGLEKEEIPLDILYEDSDILVINKEQGMTVHPGAGTYTGTLANALLGLYGEDFVFGVAVQWIARLVFTFRQTGGGLVAVALFGGIAFTALAYFIFLKGMGGSSYISESVRTWIGMHIPMLLLTIGGVSTPA